VPAFALKPFCSGGRRDAQVLHSLQGGALSLDTINPFFYRAPLAPWVAARREGGLVALERVIQHVHRVRAGLPEESVLLIEGVGGLLVPLGKDYTVRDLIRALQCEVLVVASNQLGTINHTLLTLQVLESVRAAPLCTTVLMNPKRADRSSESNVYALRELLSGPVVSVPFLGLNASQPARVLRFERKLKKTLARILN
jgi:dethiobiotin synthetase